MPPNPSIRWQSHGHELPRFGSVLSEPHSCFHPHPPARTRTDPASTPPGPLRRGGLCPQDCPMASIEPDDTCAPKHPATAWRAGQERGCDGAGGVFGQCTISKNLSVGGAVTRADGSSLLQTGPLASTAPPGWGPRLSCHGQVDTAGGLGRPASSRWTSTAAGDTWKSHASLSCFDSSPLVTKHRVAVGSAALAASSGHRALCPRVGRLGASRIRWAGRLPVLQHAGERSEASPRRRAGLCGLSAGLGLPQYFSTAPAGR